jgi:hypothetical protein
MICAVVVSVVVDGRPVDGSVPALIENDVVVAPSAPYVTAFATRIEPQADGRRIAFERDGRTVVIPIAPYVRADAARIPLALVARALGAEVEYDGAARVVRITLPPRPPLATMTPYAGQTPEPGTLPTFPPYEPPTPVPAVSGIPRPRRTPILVDDSPR